MNSEPGKSIRRLFVVDTEPSWIRSLLHAMPLGVSIQGFRVRNAFSFPGGLRGQLRKVGRSEQVSESWQDNWVSVPSWHRLFGLSTLLVTVHIRRVIRRVGQPDAILFTLPWYAGVAENFPKLTKAYYAHDTFRFYGWDRDKIVGMEARLLRGVSIGFGVAVRVVEDLRELSCTLVQYLPMATASLTQADSTEADIAAESALSLVSRPRVGCVGQIHSSAYDWDLIEYCSLSFPAVRFVFIGPRFKEESKSAANRIDAVFARPNVYWLGPKPHAHLPAFLRRFDVCINPLCVSEHNHRRSPLRLFDYLTTDRPIVSTAIAEAFSHRPFVSIGENKDEFRRLLGEALTLKAAPYLERRRDYIAANTWHARANTLLQSVEDSAHEGIPKD